MDPNAPRGSSQSLSLSGWGKHEQQQRTSPPAAKQQQHTSPKAAAAIGGAPSTNKKAVVQKQGKHGVQAAAGRLRGVGGGGMQGAAAASNPLGALGMRPFVLPAKQASPPADAGAAAAAPGSGTAGKQRAAAAGGKRAREAAAPFAQPPAGTQGLQLNKPAPAGLAAAKRQRSSTAGALLIGTFKQRRQEQEPAQQGISSHGQPGRPRLHFDAAGEQGMTLWDSLLVCGRDLLDWLAEAGKAIPESGQDFLDYMFADEDPVVTLSGMSFKNQNELLDVMPLHLESMIRDFLKEHPAAAAAAAAATADAPRTAKRHAAASAIDSVQQRLENPGGKRGAKPAHKKPAAVPRFPTPQPSGSNVSSHGSLQQPPAARQAAAKPSRFGAGVAAAAAAGEPDLQLQVSRVSLGNAQSLPTADKEQAGGGTVPPSPRTAARDATASPRSTFSTAHDSALNSGLDHPAAPADADAAAGAGGFALQECASVTPDPQLQKLTAQVARLTAENAELRRRAAAAEELQQRLAQAEVERQAAVCLCAKQQQQFDRDRHLLGLLDLICDSEAEDLGQGVGDSEVE